MSRALFLYWTFGLTGAHDTVSNRICSTICTNGKVFTPFSPPVEPTCSSYISCSKCDFGSTVKNADPSTVCLNVFSSDFSNYGEEQLTLFHGKSHLLIPHSSTYSRLSKEENVMDLNESKKKHGLFTLLLDWEKIEGVDASQCENGISEVEWTLYNTGVYRNWDITAIIETKPEATFPFCFENVEVPLDTTRSNFIGRKIPTNLKRLGHIINGRPTAVRITKIIAVNQPEMKLNPTKVLSLLLNKYMSFRIMINGVNVKQIYPNSFNEKDESEDENEIVNDLETSTKETSTRSFDESIDNGSMRKHIRNGFIRVKDGLTKFAEKAHDGIRGKGYTEPLILDSLLSLGFYSCFRVICNKRKSTNYLNPLKLKSKIPLSIKTAREVHNTALKEYLPLISPGHSVPLPINNSEYWSKVKEGDKSERNNKKVVTYPNNMKSLESIATNSGNETISIIKSVEKDSNGIIWQKKDEVPNLNIESSKKETNEISSDFLDILALIAITNSEVLENEVIIDGILKSDSLGETE
ncbi:hypothetical protein FG379_002294 [Cryptosporidium bovis]|uniref:uncharacterized protein n=1 Tax=Cryptosporidium bovis TaxID=310047 RepID=UPI00351A9E9B|nr:hypothetical protein FG379_002294 [Cryptosporidium bovis]